VGKVGADRQYKKFSRTDGGFFVVPQELRTTREQLKIFTDSSVLTLTSPTVAAGCADADSCLYRHLSLTDGRYWIQNLDNELMNNGVGRGIHQLPLASMATIQIKLQKNRPRT